MKTSAAGVLIGLAYIHGIVSVDQYCVAQEESNWELRLQTIGLQHWQDYRVRARRFQGKIVYQSSLVGEELKRRQHIHYEFRQANQCCLWLEQFVPVREGGPTDGTLTVFNSRYGFELFRHAREGPWVLRRLLPDGLRPATQMQVDRVCGFPVTLDIVLSEPLGMLLKESGCEIKGISEFAHEGSHFVRAAFDYRSTHPKKQIVRGGSIDFDPGASWVVRRSEFQLEWPRGKETRIAEYEYKKTPGFLVLSRIAFSCDMPSQNWKTHSTYDFDLHAADVPESEFTLTAFGLPEPMGQPPVDRGGSRWYLWFIAIAIITLGGGHYFRRRMVDRNQQVGPAAVKLPARG